MKKFLALMLALVMVFALAACGDSGSTPSDSAQPSDSVSPSESTEPSESPTESEEPSESVEPSEPAAPAGDYKVAMITDAGDITDQSFNQTTYEACKQYSEGAGIDFKYYKPADNTDAEREGAIDLAVAEGYNIIVVPGYLFGPALQYAVPTYPDVKFIALDVSAGDLGKMGENVPENLYCAVYQEELCGYMAGYAAVKLGYTKLGFLGGQAVPAVERYGYGYVQGADAAAKDLGNTAEVSVNYIYAGQFFGDADVTARMDTWFSNGTEIVFACGGGVYTSAAEAAAKVDGKVIGVDVDQAAIIDAYGAGMTVTSAMKGLAATVKDTIESDNWSKYAGQVATLGLISGDDPEANYVQIPMESTQWADGFTQDDYKALVKDMFDGTITVSNDVSAEPDTEIAVEYQGSVK